MYYFISLAYFYLDVAFLLVDYSTLIIFNCLFIFSAVPSVYISVGLDYGAHRRVQLLEYAKNVLEMVFVRELRKRGKQSR